MLYYRYKIQIFGLKKKKNGGVAPSPLKPGPYTWPGAKTTSFGRLQILAYYLYWNLSNYGK